MNVKIYTDGAAKGNPGPGGYGTIIQYIDSKGNLHEKEITGGAKQTTNNQMELMAVISGFEALVKPCHVTVISDSQYVVNAFTKGWISSWEKNNWRKSDKKAVLNSDLWKRLLKAMEPHTVDWVWVRGHNGHPENERCDKLASDFAQSLKQESESL